MSGKEGLSGLVKKLEHRHNQRHAHHAERSENSFKPPVISREEKRKQDQINLHLHEWIERYLNDHLHTKQVLGQRLFWLLIIELGIVFFLVLCVGFGVIWLEHWFIAVIFNTVVLQTFGLVFVVVRHAFPSEDKILEHLGNMRDHDW